MPAIVGVRGLGDVRNGQWFGRGHPMAQAENRNSNRAYTKNFDHEQPRYAGHRADTRGRC
jgi:hypothetical protein